MNPVRDTADVAMVEAGVIASLFLELDVADLTVVRRALNPAAIALALLMIREDQQFKHRWEAAGSDWVRQGEVLTDAILFVLTPESAARADA